MGDDSAPLSLLFAGPFTALERMLASRFPAWSRSAPGRESILLVPSNELRESLLRRIAASREGRTAGTRIQTLYDFALRLLAHRGVFPRELPPAQASAVLLAAVREAYVDGAGDFAGIAGTPGFLPALARTLADLEEGWLGDDALAAAGRRARERGDGAAAARWGEWRRLLASVGRKVRAAGGMSRQAVFQEAVKGFQQPGYPFRVRLYGFYDFTRLQWTLVDALLASGLLDEIYFPALFGADGALAPSFAYAAAAWERLRRAFEGNVELLDDPPGEGLSQVRARLFSPVAPAAAEPVPFQLLSAPHEEGEMRLAARRVRAWLDERPGEDVLVVSRRVDEESVSSWERVAAEYGIPAVERLHVPLSSVPPVRVLLQMIEASAEGFPRRKVIDVLSSPYRRHPSAAGGPDARPDLWDVISRELLVVSGGDWERCLAGRRGRGEDGPEDPADAEERGAHRDRLRAEVRALMDSLRPLETAKGYGELAAALRRLLRDEFLLVDDDGAEAERDRRALGALFALLDDIERIPARAAPWPGSREALAWFRTLLSAERLFVGRKGGLRVPGAVVAGDLLALRGVTADRVLFLTVNEDVVPAQLDEDPLLPDEERRALNEVARQPGLPDALSLRRRNAAEEKLLFSLPAASARREVAFSVLRGDMEGGAKRPSRYLLHLLSQFSGPGVFSEDWLAASGARSLSLSRDPFALLEGPGPASAREAALLAWRRGAMPGDGPGGIPWHRVAAILSELGERESGASPFRALPVSPGRSRPASASQLDELARCPYRYFLRRRIGLLPVEEPEEGLSLTAAEMGLIVHDVLRALGKEAAAGRGWGDVPAAAAAAFARFSRESPAVLRGLFRIQCRGIERDVAALVERERAAAEGGGFRVAAVERPFALPAADDLPALEGRVDRVDRGPAGEARIVDYKYRDGAREKAPLDEIRNGLANQMPVYLLYAGTLAPPPPSVAAALVFLRNGTREVAIDGDAWADVRGEWREAVSEWLALAASGLFPPLPHHRFRFAGRPSPRYCDACPFKDHCRVSPAFDGAERDTEALARRIAGDPRFRVVAVRRAGGEG